MIRRLTLYALLGLVLCGPAAALDPLGFEDAEKQARFEQLLGELRCLVCQNESLASSGAGLASDLRREVHRMVAQGRSNTEIKDYLLDRYGEFVLYRPQVSAKTWLLWFGPALLIGIAAIAAFITIRRRAPNPDDEELSEADRARLDALLDRSDDRDNPNDP